MANEYTGYKGYGRLRQIYIDTGEPTGEPDKDNIISDPDYIAPFIDLEACPRSPEIPIPIPEPPPPPPPPPYTPTVCNANIILLGANQSINQPNFTFLAGEPATVAFKYLNGTKSFSYTSAAPATLTAFMNSLETAYNADATLLTYYTVTRSADDFLSLIAKEQGKTYNIMTTQIGNIINVNCVNCLVSINNCTEFIPPAPVANTQATFVCGNVRNSEQEGITEIPVALSNLGGWIAFDVDTYAQPDKVEILHNGVKVATTSYNPEGNYGPFDSPTNPYANYPNKDMGYIGGADQYIGSARVESLIAPYSVRVIPTRITQFQADTGSAIALTSSGYTQRIWWKYTAGDYTTASTATVRITGKGTTDWRVIRVC